MKVQVIQRTTYRLELTEDEVAIFKSLTQNAFYDNEEQEVTAFRAAVWEALPTAIRPRSTK